MGICCGVGSQSSEVVNGELIDDSHFEMLKVVDAGAFGKVNAVVRKMDKKILAMKRILKANIAADKHAIRRLKRERDFMILFNHPFVMKLYHVYQNQHEVLFVMPFMSGGSLSFHLKKFLYRGIPEENVKVYAAEMVLGLEYIHSLNIITRDIKPQNVLLDREGHIKIADFGLARDLNKEDNGMVKGIAGTRQYMAPEVLADDQFYGKSCDVFSFGVTVYELLHGSSPFTDKLTTELIADFHDPRGRVMFSNLLTKEARSFLTGVMEPDPLKRLGCGKEGWQEIKTHPWFSDISWDDVRNRKVPAPFVPSASNYGAENFENIAALNEVLFTNNPQEVPEKLQKAFEGIDYNVILATLDKAAADIDEDEASRSGILKQGDVNKPLVKNEPNDAADYKSMN
eukprot:TRINITY_DN441_c0_g4_i2.p1 TRINITY_DN441_c0_g4~~TRINITY_DN441_c0_g4_i2.p1  ORF type:complete len:399 (-),score=99.96 TRINITY_DN441_c0_g4_i2:1755-2951(-)